VLRTHTKDTPPFVIQPIHNIRLYLVFLDEVGEMTPRMQALLLRFLETGEIQKVGSDRRAGRVNVRVIAATNRNLSQAVANGQFREDLYYRLNVIHIWVPPLRERRSDIPLLIDTLLEQIRSTRMHPVPVLSAEALAVMCEYKWPGNIRELRNVIERVVVSARSDVVRVEDLPPELREPAAPYPRYRERRRTVADDLYTRLVENGESFWDLVYPLYMDREITGEVVREIVRKGLREARGNYKILSALFNMEPKDYKRFLNFLRKHGCQVPFREYRTLSPDRDRRTEVPVARHSYRDAG
jgi:DNA-binding NtrC family response regulator